jgi:hypothetical protein
MTTQNLAQQPFALAAALFIYTLLDGNYRHGGHGVLFQLPIAPGLIDFLRAGSAVRIRVKAYSRAPSPGASEVVPLCWTVWQPS